jgi:GT2 family glycosyltransferase
MDVSIIIVNYNTCQLTLQCLQSIFEKIIGVKFEVIIVDNASSDDSVIRIKQNFPQVILIESRTNLGFGKANNLGAEYACGKYLFLLNSDTIICNNAILDMFHFMESNCEKLHIGAVGTLLIGQNNLIIHSFSRFPRPVTLILDALKGYFFRSYKHEYIKENQLFFEVDYIIGADLFLLNETFKKLKGFDPNFFMYFEETDLQKRMAKIGLTRYIIRGPQIIHLEGVSFRKNLNGSKTSNMRRLMYQESMFKYIYKHFDMFSYVSFRIFYCFIRSISLIDPKYPFHERWHYFKALFS